MIPPPFTMNIDVGPNQFIVISGNSLYELAEKLIPSGISIDLSGRIKLAMAGKSGGFVPANTYFLLDNRVSIEVTYPLEWTTGQRKEWWKTQSPPPKPVFYQIEVHR